MFSNELLDSSDGTVAVGDGEVIDLEGKLVRVTHVNQTHLRCAQRNVVTKIFFNQVNDQVQVRRHGAAGNDIALINNHLVRSEVNTGESSLELIGEKPMGSCSLSVQESGGSKHEGAGTHTRYVASAVVGSTNPVHVHLISFQGGTEFVTERGNKDYIRFCFADTVARIENNSIREFHRFPTLGDHLDIEQRRSQFALIYLKPRTTTLIENLKGADRITHRCPGLQGGNGDSFHKPVAMVTS